MGFIKGVAVFWTLFAIVFEAIAQTPTATSIQQLSADTRRVDTLSYQRVWVDAAGTATIADVAALPDSAFGPMPSRSQAPQGPKQAAWIRMDVHNTTGQTHWWLAAKHVTIDRIDVHSVPGGHGSDTLSAGTQIPVKDWPMPGLRPSFELELPSMAVSRIHVRAQDVYGSWGSFAWVAPSEHLSQQFGERTVLGIYIGVTLLAVCLALVNWVSGKEGLWLSYASYSLLMLLGQLSLIGFAGAVLWDDSPVWNEFAVFAGVPFASVALLGFCIHVGQPWRFNRRFGIAVAALMACLLLTIAAFGWDRTGLYPLDAAPLAPDHALLRADALAQLNTAMAYFAAVLGIAMLISTWHRGNGLSGLTAAALGVVLPFAIPQLLYTGHLIQRSWLTEHAFVVGLMVESLAVLFVLHRYARQRAGAQSRLLSLGLQDALTGLENRTGAAKVLAPLARQAQLLREPLPCMIIRLANDAELARQYGQDAADQAMVLCAKWATDVRQEGDVALRWSAQSVLVVFHHTVTAFELNGLASKLLARSLQPNRLLAPHIVPALHIGLALLPCSHGSAAQVSVDLEQLQKSAHADRSSAKAIQWLTAQ